MTRNEYERPILTVDVALFALIDGQLHILLIHRDRSPFKGKLALPGGYVHVNEDGDTLAAARRVAKTKLGIDVSYMEQLGTFSGKKRDPRGWSASVVYLAMVKPIRNTKTDDFYPIDSDEDAIRRGLPSLAFDHNQIVEHALQRVQNKTSYSSLPLFLMPPRFSLGELQSVYEDLTGIKMDRASFRRRIIEQEIVEPTGVIQEKGTVSHRPAELYRPSIRTLQLFEREMGTKQ